jgi:membrane protein DedA with SNARE-associated domain
MSCITTYGYPGVFAVALLEIILQPIPSELIFPLVGFTAYSENLGIEHAIGMATAGPLGYAICGIIIYYTASKVGWPTILRYGTRYFRINESSIQRAELWFERYGKTVVFLGRMAPGVREIISIPAGISNVNLIEFMMFAFLGSLDWKRIFDTSRLLCRSSVGTIFRTIILCLFHRGYCNSCRSCSLVWY